MAVTVGNVSNSGDPGAVTSYSWNHTCLANTTCLVVAVSASDTTQADRPISGITYNSVALSKADEFNSTGADATLTSIWYLPNPPTGSSLSVQVTHAGKCTDTAGTSIDLLGTDTVSPYNGLFQSGTGFGVTGVYTTTINSVPTGGLSVGVFGTDLSSAASISVTTGTERSEVDTGAFVHGTATVSEIAGSTIISWTTTSNSAGRLASCAFEPPSAPPPTVDPYIGRQFFQLLGIGT